MKWFVLLVLILGMNIVHATFTTRDGVVIVNCTPKVDPESKSQCESFNNYNQLKKMNDADSF